MNIENILSRIENEEDRNLIKKAYAFMNDKLSDVYHSNGELLEKYVLGVTSTLVDFNADCFTIVGNLLYKTINNGVSSDEIEKEFGETIIKIVLGISKFDSYDVVHLQEILDSLPEGKRVLFVKLAERFYEMQSLQEFSVEYQKDVAQDTLNTLVPLALRFRFGYIKSRLEDLSLYYLDPEIYNLILGKLGASSCELKAGLDIMKANVENLLAQNNISAVVKSRVKNIYGIYCKLSRGKNFDDIYDILALRILVDQEHDCNRVAELIHSKYEMIPSRFKNYISCPKENMYQSLHTTVIGEDNRFYEIQIRTNEMHKNAEEGSASYVVYKEK